MTRRDGREGSREGSTHPSPLDREEAALELARVRDRIDELDRRIVELLNERATLGRTAGRAPVPELRAPT